MKRHWFLLLLCACVQAQTVSVNKQNKTIAVTAQQEVVVPAELAKLNLGLRLEGKLRDEVYRQSVSGANKITRALKNAGIPVENIESSALELKQTLIKKEGEGVKIDPIFVSSQSWVITVPALQAQKALDVALQAGANQVSDVEWTVAEPNAIEARAAELALSRTRVVAQKMADSLKARLGELLYASNTLPELTSSGGAMGAGVYRVGGDLDDVLTRGGEKLELFPQKVTKQATVYAVFSIE
jgi:uncharacterized protein